MEYEKYMKNKSAKTVKRSVPDMRELLRVRAEELGAEIARQVSRATSYEADACLEYREELQRQRRLMAELLYLQRCRYALELALADGYATCKTSITDTRSRSVSYTVDGKIIKMRIADKTIQPAPEAAPAGRQKAGT